MSKPMPMDDSQAIADKVRAGDLRTAARLMRDLDDRIAGAENVLKLLYPHTGHALVVGITGNPGAGKSTVVDALIAHYRGAGKRIAVVAVDPSSPFSGGAILGDRIRMQRHATDPGVFIRSLATRGHLGGLSRSTADVVTVFDAMGYDVVLVETVGVGQDEVEIVSQADTTVVVTVPGLGDEIQAIKAGILEIADVLVVNKADREGADRSVRDLVAMLELRHSTSPTGEMPQIEIVKTVATTGAGIDELVQAIEKHRERNVADTAGPSAARRHKRAEVLLGEVLQERMRQAVARALATRPDLIDRIAARTLDPYSAADQLELPGPRG
ncbi:MAG TPA: methylmalonyl Co-A mutase-associated GTPase MeaB [Polyangia bacterium]|jgi:LAO/AO transport system kinase|nr:methylmalonyl Co-A mutase-associated GTPase MeaB [Polyangia bacterium]